MLLIAGLLLMFSSFIGMLVVFTHTPAPWFVIYCLLMVLAIFGSELVIRHVNR